MSAPANPITEYRDTVRSLAYGKRLPGAVYVFCPRRSDIPPPLWDTVQRAEVAAEPAPSWNLLKIHTDQFALTFLSYPAFESDPHPALAEATRINLRSGSVLRTDYRKRSNPPILHRKETFLPPDDPRISAYAELTRRDGPRRFFRARQRLPLRWWISAMF